LPGSEAPCVHCGVFVRIPELDAEIVPSAPPAPPLVARPSPAPVVPTPVVAAAPRKGHALRWVALFVVVVLIAGALGTGAYLSLPPTPSKMQRRLVTWDAAGDGSAYKIYGYEERRGGGSNAFERLVDLDGKEFLLRNGEKVFHQRGDEYYITFAESYKGPYREPTVGRDAAGGNPFESMPARVLNRTDRFYVGILGSHSFTLELDEDERFQTLYYQNHRGDRIRLHYDYAEVKFPSFVRTSSSSTGEMRASEGEIVYASLPRNAANFPQPERGAREGRVLIDWHMDARPAEDYSVRFTDPFGELMAETRMSSVALPGGFSFAWDDRNKDGLVDEGDAYTYAHPEGLTMSFYDGWARQPVGSPRRDGPWDPQWDLVTPSWRLYSLRQSS
jgi:hypothetical protein